MILIETNSKLNDYIGERNALKDVPNALGFQRILETSTNGYLVRQYLYSSLYDRMRYLFLLLLGSL